MTAAPEPREHTTVPPPPWWAQGGTRCAVRGCGRTLTSTYDLISHQIEHNRQHTEEEESGKAKRSQQQD